MLLKAVAFDWGHTVVDENRDGDIPLDVRPVHLMPGVSEVLPRIALPLALWANTRLAREYRVRTWLRRAGLDHVFRWVMTSVDAGARKPTPQFFEYAFGAVWARQGRYALCGQSAEHGCGRWAGIRNPNGVAIGT